MSILLTSTPTGAANTKNVLSGINVKTSPVHVGEAQYEELIYEDYVNVTIGIFFDGTLNNRKNTQANLGTHLKNLEVIIMIIRMYQKWNLHIKK